MCPIFWADGPPSALPRIGIQVFSLPPGGRAFVRFLGPAVGVWLHWKEVRTWPCQGRGCTLCAQDFSQRWKGYAPALLWSRSAAADTKGTWKTIVCELTEAAAAVLAGVEARGLVVELYRPGRRANGPLSLTLLEQTCKDPLPDPFDVRPILCRLWGLRERVVPVAEPNPDLLPFQRPDAGDTGKEAQA